MSIGQRVEKLMNAKGWSEGELSRQSGVPQPTIHRIIKGESQSPRQQNIEKLAKAFGTTASDLWGERPFHPPALELADAPQPYSQKESTEILLRQLSSAHAKASPKSQGVISRLIAAAEKGSLDDAAWTLIGNLLTELEK